jgi:hypothetical protein
MTQQSFERLCFATSSRVNDFLFESSFLLSFDFFFAKEGNDLLKFCFLSVVVVVVVVIAAKAEYLVSFLFVVRGRSSSDDDDDDDDDGNIPLKGERENFCGLERTNERDLSSVGVRKKHSERQM